MPTICPLLSLHLTFPSLQKDLPASLLIVPQSNTHLLGVMSQTGLPLSIHLLNFQPYIKVQFKIYYSPQSPFLWHLKQIPNLWLTGHIWLVWPKSFFVFFVLIKLYWQNLKTGSYHFFKKLFPTFLEKTGYSGSTGNIQSHSYNEL